MTQSTIPRRCCPHRARPAWRRRPRCSPGAPRTAGTVRTPTARQALPDHPPRGHGDVRPQLQPVRPHAAPMTQQAIYESLLVFNPADGTRRRGSRPSGRAPDGRKSITFTLRDGVKWSDGQPLAAEDVASRSSCRRRSWAAYDYLDTVTAEDANTVTFTFNTPFSPALYELGQLSHPARSTSGPRIARPGQGRPTRSRSAPARTRRSTSFQSQSFVLRRTRTTGSRTSRRSPGIQMLAFAGNDGANLAAANGEVDWADQFIPNIEKTFVAKDTEHRHYWFPATGRHDQLAAEHHQGPLRRRRCPQGAEHGRSTATSHQDRRCSGYTNPADCTGLSDSVRDVAQRSGGQGSCTWTKRGRRGGQRAAGQGRLPARAPTASAPCKDGKPFEFKISVGATSSDWLSVANIIAQNLGRGRRRRPRWTPRTGPPWSPATRRQLRLRHRVEQQRPEPVPVLPRHMGTETVKPVGEQTFENYHRFGLTPRPTPCSRSSRQPPTRRSSSDDRTSCRRCTTRRAARPAVPRPGGAPSTTPGSPAGPTEDNPYATLSTRPHHGPGADHRWSRVVSRVTRRPPTLAAGPPRTAPALLHAQRGPARRTSPHIHRTEGNRALRPAPPGFLPGRLLGVRHPELPAPALYARRPRLADVRQSQGRMQPGADRAAAQALRRSTTARSGSSTSATWQNIFTGQMGVSISRFPTPVTEVIAQPDRLDPPAGRHRAGDRRRRRQPAGHPGRLAARRRLDSALPPVLVFIGSFPYFWLAMGALYLFGVVLGWFPIRHAFSAGTEPGCHREFIADVAHAPGAAGR